MAKPKAKKKLSFRDRVEVTLNTIKSPTFRVGFSTLDMWIKSPNLAFNRRFSGRFDRAMLFGRNYMLYGESGSAKSLMAAYLACDAQKTHNALVVWIDVEKATDDVAGQKWLERTGLDMENLVYLTAATIEDAKKIIASICSDYRKVIYPENGEPDEEDVKALQPIVFIMDSWSALLTDSQWENALKGINKGDQGQKTKQLGDTILAATHLVGNLPILIIGIAHIYDNQDMDGPKHKTTGGNKLIYMASGCMLLTKKKLQRENIEDTNLVKHYKELDANLTADLKAKAKYQQLGITCRMEIIKSRVAKPFEKVDIQIPYLTGIDPYSGLFEVLLQEGIIMNVAQGWYGYIDPSKPLLPDDEESQLVKFQKNSFRDIADKLIALSPVDISNPDISDEKEVIVEDKTTIEETVNE